MDGAGNADSDHSLTWEDFFGSTSDLTPTLIGIYDSLLEPPLQPVNPSTFPDTKENIQPPKRDEAKRKMALPISNSPSKDPRLIAGGVKLPGFSKEESPPQVTQPQQTTNRESNSTKMSYVSRFKSFALRKNNSQDESAHSEDANSSGGANKLSQSRLSEKVVEEEISVTKVKRCTDERVNVISKLNSEVIAKVESNRKHWLEKSANSSNSFDNLSPNVKRMLSSAGAENPCPKTSIVQPKKQSGLATVGRSSYRSKQSNIPLMGATSKITQSGVDIVSTADIYDRPSELTASLTRINVRSNHPPNASSSTNGPFLSPIKSSLMSRVTNEWSSVSNVSSFSPEKKSPKAACSDVEDGSGSIYDVPLNSSAIYDVPTSNKKADLAETTRKDSKTSSKRNLLEVEKKDSMETDANDFVMIDSPEKPNHDFVMIDPPDGLTSAKADVQSKISPSKPAALNIALAIRNLGETCDQNRSDTNTRQAQVFEADQIPEVACPLNSSMLYSQGCGSVGNLKSPEHDGRSNLSSVPRPLSMSSIASSSSTSSSGAQNKGVNSAYLASIESLDDHSDVDSSVVFAKNARLVQATEAMMARDAKDGGIAESATPLARAPTPPRPRYCDPSLSQLQRVCTEIVDTEGIYVEDLRQVVEGYLYPWRESGTFSPDDLDHLFSNIEDIYHFNRTFSEQLEQCNLEPISIARCFVLHSEGFRIYSRYCTGYPNTMAALARLAREPEASQQLRARQAGLGHPLPLGSYLLKPVQRILKYHLLLQNLVKQCMCHETEYALHKMTGIAQHINDMKKRHEHTVRVQEIQSLLYGWHGQDLTTYGELCAEGTFRVFGAKAMRHAFLFDKMLLLTKNKEYGILAYKSHIMCNNLMLVESIQGQPLSFHVIPFDCPRMQVTLQARNVQHKREWTLLLKRVILENYNAVIPSHARQLVMELGQNKTDDDILAEKSSTLISHSSMRKQLSAPEYLEKRKLERERRKSFESGLRHRLKRSARKGQNADGTSGTNGLEKDKSLRNDSAFDEDICDCHNTCTNVDCTNYELCKDCQNGYVCSDCKSDSIYLCKACQVEKDRLNYSDSNYDCDEDERIKCSRCDASEFQSQSDVSYGKKGKCLDCDKSIHYIDDQGSRENCSENRVCVKCSSQKNPFTERENFKCSMEEMARKNGSCERCPSCNGKGIKVPEFNKKHYDMLEVGDDRFKIRESINLNLKKTCLKCQEIRENITMEDSLNYSSEAIGQTSKCEHDSNDSNLKRVSKDDSITLLTVPKPAGTLRRKSEPGMSNINFDPKDWKKSVENEMSKCAKSQEELVTKDKSFEGRCLDCGRITVTCSNCGRGTTVKKNSKCKHRNFQEIDSVKSGLERKCRSLDRDAHPVEKKQDVKCNTLEVKMYNSKTVPKKISKIKKNRAKTLRHLAVDSTAKFYTDFTTDNVLHISESTDSINTLNSQKMDIETKVKENTEKTVEGDLSQNADVDDDLYRSLIQKTDSFKQSEIDKDKTLIKKEAESSSEVSEKKPRSGSNSPKKSDVEDDAFESCDDGHERPLEQIISQLLMQNREFQKILKRHQLRNATNRRHQRLLKSHSNPEKIMAQSRETPVKIKPKYGRQTSAVESLLQITGKEDVSDKENEQVETGTNATEFETVEIQEDTVIKNEEDDVRLNPDKVLVEEHIYETLIVSPDKKYSKRDPNALDRKNKTTSDDIPCLSTFAPLSPPKNDSNDRVVDVPNDTQTKDLPLGKQTRVSLSESDYVYLCFDGNKNIDAYRIPSSMKKVDEFEDNGEYAVPTPSPQKVQKDEVERRLVRNKVTLESEIKEKGDSENHYDNGSEVWKRISNDTVIENPAIKNRRNKDNLNNVNIDDYLESENGPQSPNIPEIWLKSQKEHFTTPRDKKSGSLPRSFQVNLSELEEKTSPMMKNKTTIYNKVYLNKDGKVLQTDRPFTIASDYSEISYEDIERFIKGDDNSALKFPCDLTISNRSSRSFMEGDSIDEAIDCVSRSTLELEAEIDRCYKNNFEMRREQLKNLNSSNNNLLLSAQLMDQSISSSMEVMNEKTQNNSQEDIPTSVHPEHKIYKTTANVLSLKSVLNRFKLKSRSSQEQTATTNVNIEKEKDAKKIDGKKISTPKHNSRNLMQRFKSIINDEQHENNIAEALNLSSKEILNDDCKGNEIRKNGERKNWKDENILQKSLTVIVTKPDESPDKNIVISKSFCETTNQNITTMPLEYVSRSCNNITKSTDSLVANTQQMSQSVQFSAQLNQGVKSAQSSVQDLNKLPIYKQGSRHLGARIAQSDYADPKALFLGDSNSDLDKVNIFINKNALRPDSLLSNSSHFTSSSEGYANANIEVSKNNSFLYRDSRNLSPLTKDKKVEHSDKTTPVKIETESAKDEENRNESSCTKFHFKIHSDESFYEKSFEEIENLFGNEIFRDSAIYSDPEDNLCYGIEKKTNESFTKTAISKKSCFINTTSVMKEKIDKLGVKSVSEEVSKSVSERPERRSCEMPVITSTSYLSTIEHVTNSTVISEVMRPPSTPDKMKDLESSSVAKNENSNENIPSTSQKIFSLAKSTTSKPAPPVPTKPLFKSNLLHGIKGPTVFKSIEIPVKSAFEEMAKNDLDRPTLRYTTKNIDKNLKITENDPTDKDAIIKTELDVSPNSDVTQHQVRGKLNIILKSPEKRANVFQFPSPKSPTEKFKLGIPRPSCERSTSSNIQLKRMSFERCSLDSASVNRRSKSVTTDGKNTTEEKLITKSVQERKKEIELMTLNEQKQKNYSVINRKSVDGSEHSIMAFNRSISMKTPIINISSKDQSKYNANINNSIPILKVPMQKCNIPVAGSSSVPKSLFIDDSCKHNVSVSLNGDENISNSTLEKAPSGSLDLSATNSNYKSEIVASGENSNGDNDVKDENSKGGWVKLVVNRFQ